MEKLFNSFLAAWKMKNGMFPTSFFGGFCAAWKYYGTKGKILAHKAKMTKNNL